MDAEFRLAGRFGTPVVRRFTTGYDGTRISYYVAGRGPRPWVLAPGLGTNILCWKYLFEEYAQRYTMYTWDPRGTYASAAPSDLSRLHVEDHERDMVAVCAAEGLDRFVAGGWSMGVEISLEFCRNHPERVRALTLINGPYEHVLSTALGLPGADRVFPALLRAGTHVEPYLSPYAARLLSWRHAPRALIALGLLTAGAAGPAYFHEIMREFSTLDFSVYLRLLLALDRHSAAPYLHEIRVPTVVTAGTHDLMTPVATARELHRRIAGSELHLVPGGTHYTMTEFPVELHRGLTGFLRRADPEAWP